jgi:hypothetical protein
MELKRGESAREAVVQLASYMDRLRAMFPGRKVRGIIISGREDAVGLSILGDYPRYQIDWYCYKVDFTQVAVAPATGA